MTRPPTDTDTDRELLDEIAAREREAIAPMLEAIAVEQEAVFRCLDALRAPWLPASGFGASVGSPEGSSSGSAGSLADAMRALWEG